MFGAGLSFYKGASYILNFTGAQACEDSNESYCYGSPIVFPFVNPKRDLTSPESEPPVRVRPADFRLSAHTDERGLISEVYVTPPTSSVVTDLVSTTTVQLVFPDGRLCLFATPFFADGGLSLVRPEQISRLYRQLERGGYIISPVSTRIFVSSRQGDGPAELNVLDIGYVSNDVVRTGSHVAADLSLLPFDFDETGGLVVLRDSGDQEEALPCLGLAKRAGLLLGRTEEQLLSNAR